MAEHTLIKTFRKMDNEFEWYQHIKNLANLYQCEILSDMGIMYHESAGRTITVRIFCEFDIHLTRFLLSI